MTERRALAAAIAAAGTLCSTAVLAQGGGDFYKGKTIEMFIGSSTGGGYDQYGRLLARHMGKHIPGNPQIVAKNMPAGGGRQAINHVYNVAQADGTAIGTTIRGVVFDPLLGEAATRIDAERMTWIGSLNSEVSMCVAWHDAPFKTIDDLRKSEMTMGSSAPTSAEAQHPKLINRIAGTKIRVVIGYKGSTEVHIAMERGEVQGRCGFGWDSIVARYGHWLKDKKIVLLAQFGLRKHPDLPNVTSILELARTTEDRQLSELLLAPNEMGRPFYAPPNVPADRVAILRRAFDATVKDPEFIADAQKQKVEILAMSGEEVEALVKRIYATPKPVVEIGKQVTAGGG